MEFVEPFLFHVSQDPNIERFDPRTHTDGRSLVWAICARTLPNYLLPRDCPRICVWQNPETTKDDQALLENSRHTIFIEKAWTERARSEQLTIYQFNADGFSLEDENAGYFTSTIPQTPSNTTKLHQPTKQISAVGVALKTVDNLWPLAKQIENSSLGYSMIRMRNAAPIQSTPI